VHVRGMVWRRI